MLSHSGGLQCLGSQPAAPQEAVVEEDSSIAKPLITEDKSVAEMASSIGQLQMKLDQIVKCVLCGLMP